MKILNRFIGVMMLLLMAYFILAILYGWNPPLQFQSNSIWIKALNPLLTVFELIIGIVYVFATAGFLKNWGK